MANESVHKTLDRVRSPRVHIKYEVETEGGMLLKELPFVVGVLGDFSGKPDKALPPLKDRKFVNIDRDNFDEVMAAIEPRLAFRVEDKLSGNPDQQINVELRLRGYGDLDPVNVAKQVEPLRKLLETRERLKDLLNKMEGNDKLVDQLDAIINNTEARDQLRKALGVEGEGGSGEEKS